MIKSTIYRILKYFGPKEPEKIHIPVPAKGSVKGDWFVDDGCCTLCNVPMTMAPELFDDYVENGQVTHCFVKKQPININEETKMIEVCNNSELACIYYCGNEQRIINSIPVDNHIKTPGQMEDV